ncbi:MAG: Stp1/IreP family PP2C-type Ser/Thr phosphatase [Myxococcaceae bacterium]
MKSFALSDLGKKRERNEDAYLCISDSNLYVVADGMGGHVGGQRASQLATESVKALVLEHISEIQSAEIAQLMADSLRAASKRIHEETRIHPELKGMGTTVTALMIHEQEATVAHVGDSRAYLIREGEIQQLSEDHSLVQEQFRAGLISLEQARHSRYRNIITRSIGFEDDVDVDMMVVHTQPADIFLLCTDGLTTLVEDSDILRIILQNSPETAGQKLIDLANERGGNDNITVVLVYV